METLVICNDPPDDTERSLNGLRLAGALARRDGASVREFLLCFTHGEASTPGSGKGDLGGVRSGELAAGRH